MFHVSIVCLRYHFIHGYFLLPTGAHDDQLAFICACFINDCIAATLMIFVDDVMKLNDVKVQNKTFLL